MASREPLKQEEGRLGRRALDRRRLASWTSAWAITGPRWTRRQ
jgi:hypothetical protein